MENSLYYNIDGSPTDFRTWADNHKNRFIKATELGDYVIKTIFCGIDQSFGDEDRPALFETGVFLRSEIESLAQDPSQGLDGLEFELYSTYQEALAGHGRMVEKWRNFSK